MGNDSCDPSRVNSIGAFVEGANEGCCEKRAERIPEISYYAILFMIVIVKTASPTLSQVLRTLRSLSARHLIVNPRRRRKSPVISPRSRFQAHDFQNLNLHAHP